MTETDKPIIGQLGLHVCIQVGSDCLLIPNCPGVLGIEYEVDFE